MRWLRIETSKFYSSFRSFQTYLTRLTTQMLKLSKLSSGYLLDSTRENYFVFSICTFSLQFLSPMCWLFQPHGSYTVKRTYFQYVERWLVHEISNKMTIPAGSLFYNRNAKDFIAAGHYNSTL